MKIARKRRFVCAAFTLIETIAVLIVLGILSASVAPLFMQSSSFNARTTRDEIIASVRYAQQLASADQSLTIAFVTTTTTFSITRNGVAIALADSSGNYPRTLDDNLSLSPATTLTFSSLGDTTATTFTLNALEKICVAATGYAYAC